MTIYISWLSLFLWLDDVQFKRYILSSTVPLVLVLTLTSQLLRNRIWLLHEIKKILSCASKTTFSEVIISQWVKITFKRWSVFIFLGRKLLAWKLCNILTIKKKTTLFDLDIPFPMVIFRFKILIWLLRCSILNFIKLKIYIYIYIYVCIYNIHKISKN